MRDILIMFFFILINFLIMFVIGPKLVADQVKIYSNENQIYICTEWDSDILQEYKEYVENGSKKEICIADETDKVPSELTQSKMYENLLLESIRNRVECWVIVVLEIIIICWSIQLIWLPREIIKRRKYYCTIEQLKYKELSDYKTSDIQIYTLIQKLDFKDRNERKRNEDYLNMAYKIAEDAKMSLEREITELEKSSISLMEYEKLDKRRKQKDKMLTLQNKIKKVLRTFRRKRRERLQKEMLAVLNREK